VSPLVVPIVETVGRLADDLFTSDEERLKAQIESDKLGLEAARIDADLIKGQQEINKVEAASTSTFVAGWRPALGWVSVAGMAYQYILYPLLTWAWAYLQAQGWIPDGVKPPPLLDIEALMVLLAGILGLATNRTFEKVKGVAR
jgi:hypothetical protein